MSSPDAVIVGSVGLDDIETPREKRTLLLGGSASYACAAASFFCRPGMVGIVGDDFPQEAMDLYKNFHIDLDGLQQVPGKTFYWSGVYEENMDNRRTLITDLNVFEHFSPQLPARYRSARHLFLGNIAPELQLNVLSQMDNPRFVMVDTMDLWINIAHQPLLNVISKVDLLTLNESEARLLTDANDLLKAARQLLELGPRFVLIKRGSNGSMLFDRLDGVYILPAYPTQDVRDPTGAGDTFAGGFMGYLASSPEINTSAIHRAALYGTITVSFGVERFSMERLAEIDRLAIETRLDEFRKMTAWPG